MVNNHGLEYLSDAHVEWLAAEQTRLDARTDGQPITLDEAHAVFRRWLGEEYDLDALDVMLATAAVEQLDGDPVWLLIISGSGNAKTETVQALDGIGATVTSTISSPGALLSATSQRERTEDATGGLLRKIGDRGVLVVKDVTSILSMNRDMRAEVLGAIREVYDGRWSRNVGTDGGKTLEWAGRIALVGAVTTAWDRAHDVIASMGDRFVLLRMDSTEGRQSAGRQAIGNTGHEVTMRAELAAAVAGVLAGMEREALNLDDAETDALLAAAGLVKRWPGPAWSTTTAATSSTPTPRRCPPGSPSSSPRSSAGHWPSVSTGARRCGWRCGAPGTPCRRFVSPSSTTSPSIPARPPRRSASGSANHARPSTDSSKPCTCSACSPAMRRRPSGPASPPHGGATSSLLASTRTRSTPKSVPDLLVPTPTPPEKRHRP